MVIRRASSVTPDTAVASLVLPHASALLWFLQRPETADSGADGVSEQERGGRRVAVAGEPSC